MKIFVGNLPFSSDEDALRKLFSAFGQIESVEIIYNKLTNKSTGIGFVTMPYNHEAEKAIKSLNNSSLEGRAIIVNQAIELSEPADQTNQFQD
ncbi:RNA recognition motif domain-containing protein [Candidatus Margulisiibacteriota bacterium]